jgi:alcohol dehydrogenase (cytochrome c)
VIANLGYRVLLAGCLIAVRISSLRAQRAVRPADLLNPPASEWLSYGRTYDNQRYSPLRQITAENVTGLVPGTVLRLNMDREFGIEATPIVVDGIMFVTTAYDHVFAYDLRTGKRLWRYTHRMTIASFCCGPVNRGVAVVGGSVFVATLDAHLVALNSRTGAVRWNITTHAADSGYSHTAAPLVVGDKVIVGVSGGEYGIRGSVTAYSTDSGRLLWRFYTIPSPTDGGWWGSWKKVTPWGDTLPRAIPRERKDSAKYANAWQTGGAPVWTTPAYDPSLGLIFFGTGNPSPSNDGSLRPGDNLYNNATVAIEAETGRLRWFTQHTPHDLWDYDIPNPPILVTANGHRLVLHAGKDGWVYEMDAATGEPVRRSEPFVRQQNMFRVPTDSGSLQRPGIFGGANWPPSSYSPATRLVYVPARDWPCIATREDATYSPGHPFIAGACRSIPDQKVNGALTAIDVGSGKIVWRSERDGDVWGGTLATAGGLVFMGETSGWFRAYDAASGRVLWSFFCDAGVDASPITYELDHTQYIAVAAAGSRYSQAHGHSIFLFKLDRRKRDAPHLDRNRRSDR